MRISTRIMLPTVLMTLVFSTISLNAYFSRSHDFAASNPDIWIYGRESNDDVAATAVGDFNSDGENDLAIAFDRGDGPANSRNASGEIVVLLGSLPDTSSIDLASWTGDSVIIYAPDASDFAGEIHGMTQGDFNGDSKMDLAISLKGGDGPPINGPINAGDVVIIYGGSQVQGVIDLASWTGDSLWVFGRRASAAGALTIESGDFNNDNITDLAVQFSGSGAAGPNNDRPSSGEVVIIYGNPLLMGTADLALWQGDSAVIYGRDANDAGWTLAVGDFNGDGFDDVASNFKSDGPADSRSDAGEVVIVYGSATLTGGIDLRTWPGDSVTIYGRDTSDQFGSSVAACDLNRDGKTDLVACAAGGDGPDNARSNSDDIHIIFGSASLKGYVDLATWNGDSALLYGRRSKSGVFVVPSRAFATGDFTGDGYIDLAIGWLYSPGPNDDRPAAGEVIVARNTTQLVGYIDLASWAGDSVIFFGKDADDLAAWYGLSLGDISGDGLADLIVAHPGGDGPGNTRSGAGDVAIVFGTNFFATESAAVARVIDPQDTTAAVQIAFATSLTDSFLQVNLNGGDTTSGALVSAANESGSGADYSITLPLLGTGDTATIFIWTSLPTAGFLVQVRSDSGALDTGNLPASVDSTNSIAVRAFANSIILLEFLDSSGQVIGDTSHTSDVSSFYSYSVCYNFGETTTRAWAAAGFDTGTGSNSFNSFWYADTYGGRWQNTPGTVSVTGGSYGATMKVCVAGLSIDLPGAPAFLSQTAGSSAFATATQTNHACILSRIAPSHGMEYAICRWIRDGLLSIGLGRFLTYWYYSML